LGRLCFLTLGRDASLGTPDPASNPLNPSLQRIGSRAKIRCASWMPRLTDIYPFSPWEPVVGTPCPGPGKPHTYHCALLNAEPSDVPSETRRLPNPFLADRSVVRCRPPLEDLLVRRQESAVLSSTRAWERLSFRVGLVVGTDKTTGGLGWHQINRATL
jgi:hypothetical protein